MFYVQRNAGSKVCGVYRTPQTQENGTLITDPLPLADNDPEVLAYFSPPPPQPADMNAACVAGISAPPAPQFGFDLQRAFIAKAISDEAYRLGVAPGALTGAQLQALRNRIAAIYQAL